MLMAIALHWAVHLLQFFLSARNRSAADTTTACGRVACTLYSDTIPHVSPQPFALQLASLGGSRAVISVKGSGVLPFLQVRLNHV